MATAFKGVSKASVTLVTTLYTAPAATTGVVVGLVIANKSATDGTITVGVVDSSGGVTANIASTLPLPASGTVNICDNNTRITLETGDSIQLTATQTCDAHISVMEIT